jgi:DsbC/DsbD-like thiol-disulfide interchange protein
MRLIAASSGSPSPAWHAGVEIHLATGALTYWRSPGGAGVAPVFAFTDSENIAKVDVGYPAPTRIEEEGTDVYGYRDEVIFPLRITPREPDRPMTLALTLSFAVCERICLPAKATAALDLPPSPPPSPSGDAEAAAIARAEAEVPRPLSERERDAKVSITAMTGASPPSWRVVVHEDPARDLFAEAPDGWYFETRKADQPGTFMIVQAEAPAASGDAPVPVTLTLTGPRLSYELSAVLDRVTVAR